MTKAKSRKMVEISFGAPTGRGTCRSAGAADDDFYKCLVECIETHTSFGAEQGRLILVFEQKRRTKRGSARRTSGRKRSAAGR